MNRNSENTFGIVPTIEFERSQIEIEFNHKTTFNTGELIPFYVDMDVMPGDTHSVKTAIVIRMSTPLKPTMDNLFADIYYFYVRNRNIWKHWVDLMGENTQGAWTQTVEYTTPQITISNIITNENRVKRGDILDYMGIPVVEQVGDTNYGGNIETTVNQLPIRAYYDIWNRWFRDQNVQPPLYPDWNDDTTIDWGTWGNQTSTPGNLSRKPLPVYKFHDYFTSALPQPQKGEAVATPLGTTAPVKSYQGTTATENLTNLKIFNTDGTPFVSEGGAAYYINVGTGASIYTGGQNTNLQIQRDIALYTDLTQATASTINALRLSFATQRILEKDARGGTRYATEIIKNHFGITNPIAETNYPEYLGGKRIPLEIQQVAQTSGSTDTTIQGNLAGYGQTNDNSESFTKSFTEHGIIIGLICVRQLHTYQQGISKPWKRQRRLDYYWPSLAYIGEQPIKNEELYFTGQTDTNTNSQTYGFQEAWAELRYKPNRISGQFRSTVNQNLDIWHYGDVYSNQPVLSTEFLQETKVFVDRTLAVQSSITDQFICDIVVHNIATRELPLFSVPGLIDHF